MLPIECLLPTLSTNGWVLKAGSHRWKVKTSLPRLGHKSGEDRF